MIHQNESDKLTRELQDLGSEIEASIKNINKEIKDNNFVERITKNISFMYHLVSNHDLGKVLIPYTTKNEKRYSFSVSIEENKALSVKYEERSYSEPSFFGETRITEEDGIVNIINSHAKDKQIFKGTLENYYHDYININFINGEISRNYEDLFEILSIAPTKVLEYLIDNIREKKKLTKKLNNNILESKKEVEKFYAMTYSRYPEVFTNGLFRMNEDEREEVLKYLLNVGQKEKNPVIDNLVSSEYSNEIAEIARVGIEKKR